MRKIETNWIVATLVAVLLAAVGVGCAQDVGDIDRTQPDKIKKSLFNDGDEWYYVQTVTDTDFQGSFVFSALESPLKRIEWKITQDNLYAYSTVDPVEGLTDEQTGEDKQLGAVAIFPITQHFDVQRQYNPQTGEPSNVIVENSSDKPWFEREYMRVDWSQNMVDGQGMFGSEFGTFSSVAWNPPQESDEVNPNRTIIGEDYIDVTVQYAFQPDLMACFNNLGYDSIAYCEGGKIRARNSFMRITDEMKSDDYEPLVYNDTKYLTENGRRSGEELKTDQIQDPASQYYFEVQCNSATADFLMQEYGNTTEGCETASFDFHKRFGYFRTRRLKYDEERPQVDPNRRYYANRWDIWTEVDGETKPKPIVYHLNAGYPQDMIPAAKEVESQWDKTFKDAVRLKGGYESIDAVTADLQETYGDDRMFKIKENSCHPGPLVDWKSEFGNTRSADRRDIQTLFTDAVESDATGEALKQELWSLPVDERKQLCANLEWATEKRSSEDARFNWEQLGDLRYSFFNWVREYNGYWSGYGPSSADPLTGEIISGDANYAGTPLRRTAAYATDIVQYLNGELSNQDIRYGTHIRDHVTSVQDRQAQQALEAETSPENRIPAAAEREMRQRAGLNPSEVSPTNFEGIPDFEDQPDILKLKGKEGFMKEANRISRSIHQAKESDTTYTEFYEKPQVKNLLMKDTNFQMLVEATAFQKYGPNYNQDDVHQTYLDVTVPKRHLAKQEASQRWMAENNIFSANNTVRAVEGLVTYEGVAEYFKGKPREEIKRYFTDNVFIGTQLHEVGHTVGLRHNFSASMDALNYHDAYWNIQKEILTNDNLTQADADSLTGDMAEQATGIEGINYASEEEFKQASVMDYTGDLTGRWAGLGKYDQAAINFAYAEHVQVWDDSFEIPDLLWYQEWTGDYTDLPAIYGKWDGNDFENADTQTKLDGIEVIQNARKWVPIEDAIEERRQGILRSTRDWQNRDLDSSNRPFIERTVSYNFCSDGRADYVLGCDTFDHGANHTEIVNHAFNKYRFFQPFWRYKGQSIDNLNQNVVNYQNRVLSTFQVAQRPFRYYSLYQWYDLGSYTDDLLSASLDSINFYAEVLSTPEPGRYCKYDPTNYDWNENWYYGGLNNTYLPAGSHRQGGECQGSADPIDIPRGPGQYYNYKLTNDWGPGESPRVERVGTHVDKLMATVSFFNISANWINNSFLTDQRSTNITFWTLFREEMLDWMGSLIIGDFSGFGGMWDDTGGEYEPPKVVDPEVFGTGEPPTNSLQQQGVRIRTNHSFNHEFQTLAGAMLTNTTWQDFSVDFDQYIKIVKNENDKQEFAPGTQVHEFVHPITKVVYKAPQTADGRSISVKLVEWANDIKGDYLMADCAYSNFSVSDESARATLENACDTENFEFAFTEGQDVDLSTTEGRQDYQEYLDSVRDSSLDAVESVVAKMTMVRDISELTDYN